MKILRWLSQRTYTRLDAMVIIPLVSVLISRGYYWWAFVSIFVGAFIIAVVNSITEGN